jgi:HSP20 family protein
VSERELRREIEELFADLWQVPRLGPRGRAFRPRVDCYRTDDPPELTVVVELAGVAPDEIQLVAGPASLTIAGERRRPRVQRGHYERMEIDYGAFEREIALGADVDVSGARATYRSGLLTIVFPVAARPERPGPVPIEVRRQP